MTATSSTGAKPIVLAYSGGLDTSFLRAVGGGELRAAPSSP